MKHPPILNNNSWGVHLNFEGNFTSSPAGHDWFTPLQFQDWQRRGFVLWDADLRIVAHLSAGYVLKILENLQCNAVWKTSGLVISSPAFQLTANRLSNISTKVEGGWILKSQVELNAEPSQTLVEFLTAQESLLEQISSYDKEEEAKAAFSKVYRLIAAYGSKAREGMKSDKLFETAKLNIRPIFVPRRNYFMVHQSAQVCHATSKQIRAWIRKGELEALDLPGLGIIMEAEKLHQFIRPLA